jgi:hypothetical protein
MYEFWKLTIEVAYGSVRNTRGKGIKKANYSEYICVQFSVYLTEDYSNCDSPLQLSSLCTGIKFILVSSLLNNLEFVRNLEMDSSDINI